ncbi:MAG: phosphatase PAP2 family protein [Parcubacteria group bacterium]|nr:phosphatase PAP2 family protein [Parcubacteria group bacterium]
MNETIFRFFNDFALQNEIFDTIIIFLTDKFGLLLIFGLIVFLFTHKHKEDNIRNIFVIFISALAAWFVARVVKFFYFSPRPFEVLDTANVLFEYEPGDSFPSGHATFFSALATSFYFYHKYLAWIYIIGAVLIGASRVIAGIHWPFDILVGYVLGGIIGYFAYLLFKK